MCSPIITIITILITTINTMAPHLVVLQHRGQVVAVGREREQHRGRLVVQNGQQQRRVQEVDVHGGRVRRGGQQLLRASASALH